ncbi:two-component system response regulator [Sphaerotilus uruguayifluvii]|uniref:Diguanylate cyclase (GGDEF)-like protein/PAS domain S-box-containing protein n=1 Tax=Sphaerotilus uruguayifluvii TaxID=2735897 RepID=A0ABX2FZX3_9BURK|nr:EAL domain-containing protein [Leptothrix sp. C29]NRT55579.1 diguanylate cyclase (GGDEF)-like protein/PAS domain S-box-containing protein [Leptothrix sp. C29]
MNLIYVEDNPLDADLTRRMLALRAPRLQLRLAATLEQARALLAEPDCACDVLLIDMNLPDSNGIELVAQVRRSRPALTVLVLTGCGDEEAAVSALRSGADDYIIKDTRYLDDLPATIETAVRRRRERPDHVGHQVLHVLYAERTASDVDLLRRHLRQQAPHILVEAVGSAAEVLAALDRGGADALGPIDVLLLDYLLPGMNALELVQEVREKRGLDLPIVVVTGQGDETAAAQAIKLGAHDYLVKRDLSLPRLHIALESAFLRVQLERERRALAESERRFRELAATIDDVVWLSDPDERRLLYVSPAIERIWGMPVEEMMKDWRLWFAQIHPEDIEAVRAAVVDASPHRGNYELRFRMRRPDGQLRHVLLRSFAVQDEHGNTVRRAGIAQDVTEQHLQDARIQHLAYHDPLTDLPNRMLMLDRMERGLAQAQRHHRALALLFLDLDRFKTINDTLGHLVGDELLRQVAQRLRQLLPPDVTIARLGGDEFLVLVEDLDDAAQAARIADELMGALDLPFEIDAQDLHVSASVGVSLYPRDSSDAQTLLKYADTALYKAKAAGRNTYCFFSPEMDAQAHERLRLENDLRRAIERGELRVHYQPQFAADGRLEGAEALLRWQHPQRGLIGPGEFIPLAEETGLIHVIGDWVLDEACHQARQWHLLGHAGVRVAVNLSVRQLQRHGLDRTVRSALRRSGLAAAQLELEITESSMMDDPEGTLSLLHTLRGIGVQLSVDDFGTGYSSLAYLKRLPLQRLKIDRSFVDGIPDDGDDIAIVEAIVALARKMNLRIVAEGVETGAQRDLLTRLGCDEMQGYLLGRPMAAAEMQALLARCRAGVGAAAGVSLGA